MIGTVIVKGQRKASLLAIAGFFMLHPPYLRGEQAMPAPVTRNNLNLDTSKIDQLLAAYQIRSWFQGSVVIERGGNIIYERSFDSPNMPQNSGGSVSNSYRIGSVSKQFTAAAILLLQEQNFLSVSDTVRSHIPDLRGLDESITLSDLLAHTSGLNDDYMDTDGFTRLGKRRASLRELIDFAFSMPITNANKKHSYANINYNLLARIIELKNRQKLSYADFMNEHLFKKAHLSSASVSKTNGSIVNGVLGHIWDFEGKRKKGLENGLYQIAYGSGAINLSPRDLCKWDRELRNGNLLNEQSKYDMNSPIDLESGYGYGFVIKEENGIKMANHEGSIDGFLTYYTRFIDDDVCVAVTINQDTAPGGAIGSKLVGLMINKNPEIPEIPEENSDDPDMDEMVGLYYPVLNEKSAKCTDPSPSNTNVNMNITRLNIRKFNRNLYIEDGIRPGHIRLARIKKRSYYLVQTGDGDLSYVPFNSEGASEISIRFWDHDQTFLKISGTGSK